MACYLSFISSPSARKVCELRLSFEAKFFFNISLPAKTRHRAAWIYMYIVINNHVMCVLSLEGRKQFADLQPFCYAQWRDLLYTMLKCCWNCHSISQDRWCCFVIPWRGHNAQTLYFYVSVVVALMEALLQLIACITPFLMWDQLTQLPYSVAMLIPMSQPEQYAEIVRILCVNLLPNTLGMYRILFQFWWELSC